jgi:hypothetical protein
MEVRAMRNRLLALGALAVLAAAPGLHAQQQQQLQVFASIVDANGVAPKVLDPADVRVLENQVELKVLKVESVTEWPTKLQVLLDNGVGLGSENLIHLRNGLRGLLEAIPEGVEVSVYTTAPNPRPLVRPTTDKAAMLKGVDLLAPDSGAGRFIESLNEATQRIERDKTSHFPMIISVGSSAGDRNVLDRDVERVFQRVQTKPMTVHVAMVSAPQRAASGGGNQIEVGIQVSKATGGRYESIAAPVRLATLMPEMGAQVAASSKKQGTQFRITAERANASAPLAGVSLGTRSGLKVAGLSFDGRHP